MNQTQSLIVYRNPAEQYLWESGVMGNFAMIVILCIAAAIVTYAFEWVCMKFIERKYKPRQSRSYDENYRKYFMYMRKIESCNMWVFIVSAITFIYFFFFH